MDHPCLSGQPVWNNPFIPKSRSSSPMYTLILDIIQSSVILIMGVALILGQRQYRRLERHYQALAASVEKNRKDQIGLCSAAVQVDKRLMEQEKRLREMIEKVESVATQDSAGSAYYTAIDRIRKGASPQELVADCGMSQSEANLLHNLYAQKK